MQRQVVTLRDSTEYLAQMRRTLDVLGRIEPEALEPAVQDELVALYRRWQS